MKLTKDVAIPVNAMGEGLRDSTDILEVLHAKCDPSNKKYSH